ncbi:hypothetical protein [Sphingomonas nostoxanthinifaciens]|uniref:hypothetical protein n=1 Tax=Sphingomonas nostoxanthinifaciens TaxID=2872652 RepID=UPI001CC21FCF|nr:hypothetical protein [Sphingomonas nostoxanthinifaciens]UAK25928.1 hypothetical protein K8P63_07345 [Sphingomonas nostoxanthinifaciens]
MSRALNLDATEAQVTRMCAKHNAEISWIETLYSGGTRVVLKNGDAAATVRRAYGAKVLTGPVTRAPTRMGRS